MTALLRRRLSISSEKGAIPTAQESTGNAGGFFNADA